jgi:sec-independent protein translocase protein TatA
MVMTPIVGEIIGWEFLLVLAVIALLFGGSKLPKLAKSMGQASSEFRKGLEEGASDDDEKDASASTKKAVEKPADDKGDKPTDA